MYLQVVEYLEGLTTLGGKRWMEGETITRLLTDADREVISSVKLGQIKDDLSLAKRLYGPDAQVDYRYRRRLARLEERLAGVALSCPLSPSLGNRRIGSINVLRNATIGQSLMRAGASSVSRMHLLTSLRGLIYPELVWYAPPIHMALAFHEAVNRRGRQSRIELERARASAHEALEVYELLEMWTNLSTPLRKKADIARRKPLIVKGRALLSRTARRTTSAVVAIAAARLATTLSQLQNEPALGLRWLDRSREALIKEDQYDDVAQREYLTQRAFVLNSAHNYTQGVEAARQVVEASEVESSYWFNAMAIVLNLQLRKSEYSDALATVESMLSKKAMSKQSAMLIARIKLRASYAQILTNDKTLSVRVINQHKRYPLDMLVLHVLHAMLHKRMALALETIHSLIRHIDRTPAIKKDRAFWLLSRLLKVYTDKGLSLRASRTKAAFVKYENELYTFKTMLTEHAVIAPLQIWKAIVTRR